MYRAEIEMLEKPILTVEDLISTLYTMDLVVATRFHGILMSFLMMEKPVLATSNHHKMSENVCADDRHGTVRISFGY